MNASAGINLDQAFVVRPIDITTIWSILTQSVGQVTANAQCRDNMEREFQSAEQLNAYDNASSRAIRVLSIRARSKDREITASLNFGSSYSDRIRVSLDGPEDALIIIRDRLYALFADMKPWYGLICRIDFFYVIWPLLVFMSIMVLAMSDSPRPSRALSFGEALKATGIATIFFVGVGGAIWGLNRLRRRFFPEVVFAIGRGAERYDFDENIRWVVIIGFVLSVLASLLVSFVAPPA